MGARTHACRHPRATNPCTPRAQPQASTKSVIELEEWEKKLAQVRVSKEDLNRLVMNFLVTEVRGARGLR